MMMIHQHFPSGTEVCVAVLDRRVRGVGVAEVDEVNDPLATLHKTHRIDREKIVFSPRHIM